MDKFSKWTGLAHATLIKHHPKIKLSQACECLAAWLGHRTYASLRVQDLDILNKGVEHAIVDAKAAMERAEGFGFPLTREQWRDVELTLSPSGVSGMWLTEMRTMELAASLAFEDSGHPDATAIAQAIGMTDGRQCKQVLCHAPADTFPDQLRFTVHGEVRAFNDEVSLSTPVLVDVLFQRVGARLYLAGQVQSVIRNGEPYPYEPDFDEVGEYYGSDFDN